MAYFLFFLTLLIILSPLLRRWLTNYGRRKANEYMRRMMGLPPEEKPSRNPFARKRAKKRRQEPNGTGQAYRSRRRQPDQHDRIIPPEYAEDVEFTEVREFSQTEIHSEADGLRYVQEEQVSDAEYVEIRTKETNR